jgi:glycerophosphoryl diester phosphodiesterase
MFSRIIAIIIAAVLFPFMTVAPQASAATANPSVTSGFTSDPYRWLIAHRGGAAVYPEEGPYGYDRALNAGYALEADARQIKDGTWVLLHDATVDRTMTGVGMTGPVDQISYTNWYNARLKPSPTAPASEATRTDRSMFLSGFLSRYAGKAVLVIEHKGGNIDSFISMIKTRSAYNNSIMVQSFDWANAQKMQAAGLNVMYLMGKTTPVDPAAIKAAGIKYVGTAWDMTPTVTATLKAQNLVVVSYTVNTKTLFASETTEGVNGVFSDNPWAIASTYTLSGTSKVSAPRTYTSKVTASTAQRSTK